MLISFVKKKSENLLKQHSNKQNINSYIFLIVGMKHLSKEEIAWLKTQFRIANEFAIKIGEVIDGTRNTSFDIQDYKNVFEEYDNARKIFEDHKVTEKFSLKEIPFQVPKQWRTYGVRRTLYQLANECDKAIEYLESIKYPSVSGESKGELKSLREEINKNTGKIEPYIEKNYIYAIDSFEDGHVLGAALIASRIIEYYLDSLEGDNIEKQIQSLRLKIKSEKERKDIRDFEQNMIKASKFARNLLSHNITAIPEPEESLSLLSNCLSLIKIMGEV